MHRLKKIFETRNRVVIKVGTNLLADKIKGVNQQRIDLIAKSVSFLRSRGNEVALVSSGAIGAGIAALRLIEKPKSIPEKQATAAVGQPLLMEAYENAFRGQNLNIAQILLTKDDFTNRTRYLNAKNTFCALFEKGVVPVINENDTVAIEEIKLGDNDNLSAMVANLIDADLLIILTDIDGLYSDDPSKNPDAVLIPVVEKLSPQIEKLAKKSRSELSTGGMVTKLQAAKRSVSSGIAMIITDGRNPNAIQDIFSGSFKGTIFLPSDTKLNVRKKWIGFISNAKGYIVVDDGAKEALTKKQKSLLPSGILDVHGSFEKNDTIEIRDANGQEIGKGISSYSSLNLEKIKGKKTSEIEKILHCKSCDEVIHKDNLVLTGE